MSLIKEGAPVARLHARQPGVGVVHVTMECVQGVCHPGISRLHDEVTVTVLPRLRLVYPSNCGHLLLPSNGVAKIQTNRFAIIERHTLIDVVSIETGCLR